MRLEVVILRVFHHAGAEPGVRGPDPDRDSYAAFVSFSDPDATARCSRRSGRDSRGDAPRVAAQIAEVNVMG
jgi:hypothetical protein